MTRFPRFRTAALALACLAAAPSYGADPSDLLFTVEIKSDANTPVIRITNNSPQLDIDRIRMTIGDTSKHFDGDGHTIGFAGPGENFADGVSNTNNDGKRVNDLDARIPAVGPGQSFEIHVDIDDDIDGDSAEDYREVFFNNGGSSNSKVTVYSGVDSASLTLEDRSGGPYVFRGPERRLQISSVTEVQAGNDGEQVRGITLFRNGEPIESNENVAEADIIVNQGDQIRIRAPQQVYKDINSNYITGTDEEDTSAISDTAHERFVAIGMSVNNIAETADPTNYTFEITEDTEIDVKWRHYYALLIRHDFTKTRSQEVTAGQPWAGPLASDASGNPDPPVSKQWVRRGTEPVVQIDGQRIDNFSHPGLDIRYVVKGFRAYGPPNNDVGTSADTARITDGVDITDPAEGTSLEYESVGGATHVTTSGADGNERDHGLHDPDGRSAKVVISGCSEERFNGTFDVEIIDAETFAIPVDSAGLDEPVAKGTWRESTYERFFPFETIEDRQQVRPSFNMYGPGGITYVWQIQYGVRVDADAAQRNSLARVYEVVDGQDVDRTVEDGVTWFDPGAHIKVVGGIQEAGSDGQTLTGWVNGDGYYFSNLGEIDPASGTPTTGSPQEVDGTAVARWIAEGPENSRGYEITSLRRPVRTVWRYGAGAIIVNVTIGEHLFEDYPEYADRFVREPEPVTDARPDPVARKPDGTGPSADQMAEWDPVSERLYPTIPGLFTVPWKEGEEGEATVEVRVIATLPHDAERDLNGHYPHVDGAPAVALDPDPDDDFSFRSVKYTNAGGSVDSDGLFTTDGAGMSVLLFSEIQRFGRGEPREFLRVRVVDTRNWDDRLAGEPERVQVGAKITDPDADAAGLGTGFLHDPNAIARYNPFIYDEGRLEGLAARDVYDMDRLLADSSSLQVVNRDALPGPIIPVNEFPGADQDELPVVVWYDDPRKNDTIMWPNVVKVYEPRWPSAASVPRIVIASQFGSEGRGPDGNDQVVAPAIGDFPEATTYDPSRLQDVQVYNQPDPGAPGYNPNEEHALTAPSLRFADVSPRPDAIYALRDGDLNRSDRAVTSGSGRYTSHPFVLAQFLDVAADEVRMKVYSVRRTTAVNDTPRYRFATDFGADPEGLADQPFVTMVAGEPVIPLYPLGVAIGASPSPDTFGNNLFEQEAYWEDWRGSSWAVSGGREAWFDVSFFYPLAPDFWWPSDVAVPPVNVVKDGAEYTAEYDADGSPEVPAVGDSVAFLPDDVEADPNGGFRNHLPTRVLYKSEWPENPPVLKAGETLTFSGGEYRADNPTSVIVEDGEETTVETPGLPQLTAFASAEVVFDSLNPEGEPERLETDWTARVVQALDVRGVSLPVGDFPSELQPAGGRTRVSKGEYIFSELPASLQRRLRYDPVAQRPVELDDGTTRQVPGVLTFHGLLNDKEIGDSTLTAAPPAVYVLEPNILTPEERDAMLALSDESGWRDAVSELYALTRNPEDVPGASDYRVGLMREPLFNDDGSIRKDELGNIVYPDDPEAAPMRAFGPGLALVPNGDFLDPTADVPDVSYVTVVENNDASLGGSPITPHIVKVDRRERYRGAIKTVLSDNVFDENVMLRSTGDFGANADDLVFEWWYRPDDGSLNVPPPDLVPAGQTSPWKLFPDPSGAGGRGRFQIKLEGNPNAPETLLADSHWFVRYRHGNDDVSGTDWGVTRPVGDGPVNYTWAGAGNSDPYNDRDLDGTPDFVAQLVQGWIKRVLDAVNPYESRIRDFEGEAPSTVVDMIAQFGPRFEGPVALNPDKDVIENVGLIELYETVLNRGRSLSIDLSRPVSTPAISNALQLASTRISDFYMLLGNEAYVDSLDPTIGHGSDSADYGSLSSSVFTFQNQMADPLDEELALLRGVDDFFARPVYNRLFWNFTKGEGEAAYATNYNISDVNEDGFVDEADAMLTFPQGHGDAWGHYLTAVRGQYELLRHPNFNWVSRSESYNLQDIVITVDFLDERKFATAAAAKAKAGSEIVSLTYRDRYVADPNAQWQGYTDSNPDRAWGVDEWGRRAGQGAYFDWVTANALLPAEHPNEELEGIQKVDRAGNGDIPVISANLNAVQTTVDQADKGYNPLGLSRDAQMFDLDPNFLDSGSATQGQTHFDQIHARAQQAIDNAQAIWDNANQRQNLLRSIENSEEAFRKSTFEQDLAYRNRLIQIFGKPYDGTIGPGRLYPAGYEGPDTALYMYVPVREINSDTVPGPRADFASFNGDGHLSGGDLYDAFLAGSPDGSASSAFFSTSLKEVDAGLRELFAPTFQSASNNVTYETEAGGGVFDVNYTDLDNPKVDLENFVNQMPVTASGYSFQAPPNWGSRGATGELQTVLNKMIRQEAEIAAALGAWDGHTGETIRILRLLNARLTTTARNQGRAEVFSRTEIGIRNALAIAETVKETIQDARELTWELKEATVEGVPLELPTGGLSVSPGDALSLARSGIEFTATGTRAGLNAADLSMSVVQHAATIALEVAENELEQANAREARKLEIREWLKELEDQVGDEPVLRIAIFKEIQALRELSDQYRTLLDEGARLIDERAAFNKRVAAQVQRNRYQDMTFRVARNHAIGSYRNAFELAARYAYLATSAYDYETNFATSDPASATGTYGSVIGARRVGGLDFALSQLKANYDSQRSQLGFNNAQREVTDVSVRRELMRILPAGETQPDLPDNEFPAPGEDADSVWRAALQDARVPDLWELSEFREHCRPFAAATDAAGRRVPQPGIVLRFPTDISTGKNFFGKPLSGGDQAFSTSNFATKILGLGVAFEGYQTDDILNDLAASPRIYFVPGGLDVMRVSRSDDPDELRMWKVVEQAIPVPYPASQSQLRKSGYIPLLDSLNGSLGDTRRFSDFRAYPETVGDSYKDSRLVGRSVWNTEWLLIIPGATLNADPDVGLDRFIDQITDIKLELETYGQSGG